MSARVQQKAPDFKGTAVVNGEFQEMSLSDFEGEFLVLFFYPLDFTFVCPTELLAFNERLDEFHALGAKVVGVSIDSHFSHLAWLNTPVSDGGIQGVRYPLLSDMTKQVSADYGVLLDGGIALRGLFIIDQSGTVRQITINDLPIGRSVDETLRLIKAIQFTDEHGEVCPANWEPGSDTMVPDPEGSKAYFKKQ